MMYPTCSRIARFVVGAALFLPAAAAAQDWSQPWADDQDRPPRVDVSGSIGFLAPTDWSDLVLLGSISSASGVLEQLLVRDLRVEADEDLGGTVTYWRGRYGFRVEGRFSSSSVRSGERTTVDANTWLYNVGGAIGFLEYSPELWVWPYGFVGLGGVTYDLDHRISPPLSIIQRGPSARPDILIVEDDSTEFLLAIDELDTETVFALNFGIGTDFRIPIGPGGVGLRLELADHMSTSPVGVRIGELRRVGALTADTGVAFGPVHHFRASVGVVLQFGK